MRSETSVIGAIRLGGESGARSVDLSSCLDAPAAEQATREATEWIKSLRRLRVDGTCLRDRFTHRGDSLWWFIELFLARERVVVSAFKTLAAFESLIKRESPGAVTLGGGDWITRAVVPAVARRHGIAFPGAGSSVSGKSPRRRTASLRHLAETVATRLRTPIRAPEDRCDVAVFVHSAFWKPAPDPEVAGDTYLGAVIRALRQRLAPGRLRIVGIGPRISPRKGRQRRWRSAERPAPLPFPQIERYASLRTVIPSLRVWGHRHAMRRALLDSDDIRRSAIIRGNDLWPLLGVELSDAVRLQLPWSARAMDETGAALDALRPRVALTYAEAGGWGRALILEGRRRGIPVIGVQHGFIDRHVLDYLHEPDEIEPSPMNAADRGYPLPDATLVFDAYAATHLRTAGRFPASSLLVTGSPQLDDLSARIAGHAPRDLRAVRAAAGAAPDQDIVLIASKFTEIRPLFGTLVAAVRQIPSVQAVVKCHPVEAPEPYQEAAAGTSNLTVLPAGTDLAPLLRLARLVVTVNSTVAFDAMTLGIPVLVLGLPNNLSPFVDAGAMAGLAMDSPIGLVLHELLYDEARRNRLAEHARNFATRYDIRADGEAVRRSADAVLKFLNR